MDSRLFAGVELSIADTAIMLQVWHRSEKQNNINSLTLKWLEIVKKLLKTDLKMTKMTRKFPKNDLKMTNM